MAKNKFNVGDKVKVIKVLPEYERLLGEVGEIKDVDTGYQFPYEIKYDKAELEEEVEGGWLQSLFAEDELALVNDKVFYTGGDVVVANDISKPVLIEEYIKLEIKRIIELIDEELPQGRATSMVKTKLDEARLWLGEVK